MTEEQELFWNMISKDYPSIDNESRSCKNCIHDDKVIGLDDGQMTDNEIINLEYPCNICAPLGDTNWSTWWRWNGKNIHGEYDD